MLRHLSENSGRLVTKAELMQAVWPDSFVTDDSLVQCLIEIRRALGDDSHNYIKTVPRRGYIFEAEVAKHFPTTRELIYTQEVEGVSVVIDEEVEEETKVASDIAPATPQSASTTRRLSGTNLQNPALLAVVLSVLMLVGFGAYLLAGRGELIDSVAVMPFVNVSGDPEMEYLADGLTESVIRDLSHMLNLKVMSRNSVFRYKGKEIDPRAVGRELRVKAVLVGACSTARR